jgi:uncharacterized protein
LDIKRVAGEHEKDTQQECAGKPVLFSSAGVTQAISRGMMKKPFYTWDGDTLVLSILGTPNAKRDAIGKVKGHQLCVSVTAVPRAGRATDHMVRFLADEFDVPVSAIQVVSGRMNVNKQLRIKAPKRLPPVIGQQELFG